MQQNPVFEIGSGHALWRVGRVHWLDRAERETVSVRQLLVPGNQTAQQNGA